MKNSLHPDLKLLLDFFLAQRQNLPTEYTYAEGVIPSPSFFTVKSLQQHLNNPLLSPAWVHLVSQGKSVPLEDSCFYKLVQHNQLRFMNKDLLNNELKNGAAVVLEGVDILDASINGFVSKIEEALPCSLSNCVAFFSQRQNEAYEAHCDSDDVLVIQLSGKKRWHLYAPQQRRYADTTHLTADRLGPVTSELIMQPGDALFVRAGVPHKCDTVDSHSLHLAFDLLDSTPSVEQITQEANKLYDYACEEPFSPATKVMDRYIRILQSEEFQTSLKNATQGVKHDANQFRHCIGKSSSINALTKYID